MPSAHVRKATVRRSTTISGTKPCWAAHRPGDPKPFADGYHYENWTDAQAHAAHRGPL